jgi:hypothetical protein
MSVTRGELGSGYQIGDKHGASGPAVAVELLGQLHERLADSGPLEFRASWAKAVEICGEALERARSDSSPRAARRGSRPM